MALAKSGRRMFTTTGVVPVLEIVTDIPVNELPVAGSEALMPPLPQSALVKGVPWKTGEEFETAPVSDRPALLPLMVIPPAMQPVGLVQMLLTGIVVPVGVQ